MARCSPLQLPSLPLLSKTAPRHLPHARAASSSVSSLPRFDEVTDILIVGSGAGGLTASLRGAKLGLRTTVVEKEATLGGASVISGGGLWIPCNTVATTHGINDSEQGALKYFEAAVGDVGPASSLEKRRAYLTNGQRMISWLQGEGFRFHFSKGYPDYYPSLEGAFGKGGGHTIKSKVFNTKRLGPWQTKLPPSHLPLAIYTNDAPLFTRLTSSSPAGEVAGEVVGAELRTAQGLRTIRATRGVILAAGGFARNQAMRELHMPRPATTKWMSSPKGDTGDAIREGMRLGAATALLDDAWWGPTIMDPVTGVVSFALMERARPHSFIVDSTGSRFMNEAQSYTDAGHDQYERNHRVGAIPAWMITDRSHRDKYMLGGLFARQKPSKKMLDAKRIYTAPSLEALETQIGVDPKGLRATADRFNAMCAEGVDRDYARGISEYDQFFGDPEYRLNPNLGVVSRAPFYAVPIYPGDLGTKGGLLTDQFRRVVREGGKPIPGLYAIGNLLCLVVLRITYV
ncbi:hypothetical protein QQX98_010887 [Neonectria punicea]|uniref:FAD-dependent oxidoreductase 2 FAD-binding domain-containing protein n=1 Tax=Neonectria punicea TaxID=979145 RepID=A0ABR1GNA3_9HYPO